MRWRHLALFLFGLSFLVYLPSFGNKFVWDDEQFIYRNQYVKKFALKEIFSTNTIAGAGEISNYFRPLTTLSFAVDYQIWGERPFGFHLTNTLLHSLSGLVLLALLFELEKWWNPNVPSPKKSWLIWVVPLIFLLHPIQTEAVTYVNSRGDSLYVLLALASTLAFVKSWQPPKTWQMYDQEITLDHWFWLILASMLLIISWFAKEIAVATVGLWFWLWLLQQSTLKKLSLAALKKSLPQCMAIVSAIALTAGYFGLRATVWNFNNSFNFYQGETEYSTNLWLRLLTFTSAHHHYLSWLFWPHPLHMERSLEVVTTWQTPFVAEFFVILISWFGFGYWEWRRLQHTWIWLGWGWWLLFLAPVSGIIPINGLLYEHWLYLPMVGVGLAVGGLVTLILSYLPKLPAGIPPVAKAGLCSLILLYSALTIRQNYLWGDPIRFYSYTLKFSETARLHNNLAMSYADAGQPAAAIPHYQQALKINPGYPQIYHNLANTYLDLGQKTEAQQAYEQAIKLDPLFSPSYPGLINLYLEQKQFQAAWPLITQMRHWLPNDRQIDVVYQFVKTQLDATHSAKLLR